MDENKCLIIVRNEDKTLEIDDFKQDQEKVHIKYKNSNVLYGYSLKDVFIYDQPIKIDAVGKRIYHRKELLQQVLQLIQFEKYIKVIFNRNKSNLYDSADISIENNALESANVQDTLNYWKSIAKHTHIDGEDKTSEPFLSRMYAGLQFISHNSVLGKYMQAHPVEEHILEKEDTIFPFRFNPSQKKALNHALKYNISIIEGPPGTGKTQTILNILANLTLMQGKKVAVVSGNNAAVKNVYDKMQQYGYSFLVANLGNRENQTHFFEELPVYDVSSWQSTIDENTLLEQIHQSNQQIEQLMEYNNNKAKLEQTLSAYLLEQEHFERYYEQQNINDLQKLSFFRETPERIISFIADYAIATHHGKENGWLNKAKLVFKYGFINFKTLQLQQVDAVIEFQRKYYELKIESLQKEKKAIEEKLKEAKFEELLEEHHLRSNLLFKHKIYEKYASREACGLDVKTYKKTSGNYKEFLEHFPIILSTTHSLRNSMPPGFLFDYVIMDESSQVDLVTGALALSCCENVIIVGDTKQLPQVVNLDIKDQIENVEVAASYDYFDHNVLSSMLSIYGDSLPKVMLKEHYRCHPQIIGFCNQKYYNDELITFTKASQRNASLILYRTSEGNHMREVTIAASKGKFNQRELDVIKHEVLNHKELKDYELKDVGFATPYRKQVEKAANSLSEDLESDTIHKYQGREKPVMILSTVLDQTRQGKIGMKFVDDPRKINVAVSRAQEKFVLVTDHSFFNKKGKEVSDLIRYMEYTTMDDLIIDSEIVSVFDLLYKEYSQKLSSLQKRLFSNSKYKSENIMETLLNNILQQEEYQHLYYSRQVFLKNVFNHRDKLDDAELKYIKHNASVDFMIYYKLNKQPVMAIEVDGFKYHEDNEQQMIRDQKKNSIFEKYELPLLRCMTMESKEEARIKQALNSILDVDTVDD